MSSIRQLILIDSLGIPYTKLSLNGHTLLQDDQQGIADAVAQLIGLVYTGMTSTITDDLAAIKATYFPLPSSGIVFELVHTNKLGTVALHWGQGDIQWTLIQHGFEEEFFLKKGKPLTLTNIPTQLRARDMVFEQMDSAQYRQILEGQVPKWERFALIQGRSGSATQPLVSLLNRSGEIPSNVLVEALLYDQPTLSLSSISKKLNAFYANWEIWQLVNKTSVIRREALDTYDQYLEQQTRLEDLAQKIQASTPSHLATLQACQRELAANQAKQESLSEANHRQQIAFELREEQLLQEQAVAHYMLAIAEKEQAATDVFSAHFLVALGEILAQGKDIPHETLGQQAAVAALDQTLQQARLSRDQAQLLLEQNWQKTQQEQMITYKQSLQQGWKEIHILQVQLDALTQQKHEAAISAAETGSKDQLYDKLIQLARQKAEADQAFSLAQSEIVALEAQQSLELELHQAQKEAATRPLSAKADQLEADIHALTDKIDKRQAAFYGWLDTRYPGWQKTIGKVVKEEVLFDPHLSPNVVRLNDLLYGIHLDLDEIETTAPTQEELFQVKKDAQAALDSTRQALEEMIQKQEKTQLTIERRYRQKIRQAQKALQLARTAAEQFDLQFKKLQTQQQSSPSQLVAQQQVVQLAYQIEHQTQLIQQATTNYQQLLNDLHSPAPIPETQAIDDIYHAQVEKASADKTALLEKWNQSIPDGAAAKGGIITWAQAFIQTQQEGIHEPLSLLQASRLPRWKIQAIKSQRSLEALRKSHMTEADRFLADKQSLALEAQALRLQLEQLTDDQRRLDALKPTIESFSSSDELSTPGEPTLLHPLINQFVLVLGEIDQLGTQILSTIAPIGAQLAGNTIYQAPLNLPDQSSLSDWMECFQMLSQIESIEQIETALGEEYATLVHQVVEDTQPVFAWESLATQRLHDWQERLSNAENFPHTPEIDLSPAHLPWINTLRDIHTFAQEHGHQIGAASLFNQTVAGERNREAVQLLGQWVIQLQQWRVSTVAPHQMLTLTISYSASHLRKSPAINRLQQLWVCGTLLSSSINGQGLQDLALIDIDLLHRPYWLSWLAAMEQTGAQVVASSGHGLGAAFFQTIYQFQAKEGQYEVICLKQP